jgi:predicted transcriptional regulator with HTH domain
MNPRSKSRVPVNYRVAFAGDSSTGEGVLTNLTIGGGQIESDVQFVIGAHLSLHVEISGARSPIVIALAIVRWKQDERYGVEFVRFEGEAKQQLQEMLNQQDG